MTGPLLEVQNLYHFYGSRLVFKGIDCTLDAGMTVLVAGANGAGKSTLLKCIAGLVRPTGGRIVWHVDDHAVAYMGHATFLYPSMTALQNLAFWNQLYGLGRSEKDMLDLLVRVDLRPYAQERTKGFSRGMAQRLALARILLLTPQIILLDEPSTGLDSASCELLLHEIAMARQRGAGILWVSHDLARDREHSDHILCLAAQTMTFWGSVQAFMEHDHHAV